MIQSPLSPKILVVRLSSLGDVVLTGPVYKSLKARWPDARVCVLTKSRFVPALSGHPCIDEIIPYTGVRSTVRAIRAGAFTHLLDLHANLRSFLIRSLARVPNTVVYTKDALARRLFVFWRLSSPSLQKHTVDRYLEALSAWGAYPTLKETASLSSFDWAATTGPRLARKILVMQSAFLGDSLLTLPLLRRLKHSSTEARIEVLTIPKTADIFKGAPGVDEVLIDDKRGAHKGLFGFMQVVRLLRSREYDLAVIPHRSLRSALLAALAAIPRRVGFNSSAGRFLLTDIVPFAWPMHDLERNLLLTTPLGTNPAPEPAEARYVDPPELPDRLADLLLAKGVHARSTLVGIHPGSAWPTKRWLPDRFAELCRRLKQNDAIPVLVGGPEDKVLGEQIAGCSPAINLIGQTDLNDLKALLGRLQLFVTNDSGPMHLAAACGVPVVALFGATSRELGFFPYGPRHIVIENELSCRPCGLHGSHACPEGHFLCMRLITVDRVHEACQQILTMIKSS